MLPPDVRLELNGGNEISLVPGLRKLRAEVFDALDYDTVLVLDSHWHTTVEFVVAAHEVRAGLFTSDELPRGMCRVPYDWRGDPELARATAALGERHGTWITALDDPYLPVHYATVNLWTYLGRGLDKRWITISNTAQTGDTEDFLRVRPEAKFAHYLMMAAALGGHAVTAPGRAFSDYENSVGTGQVHLWFDRPAAGWSAPATG